MLSLPAPVPGRRDGYVATLALAGRGTPLGVLHRYQMMFGGGGGGQDIAEQIAMSRIVADNHFAYASVVGRVGDTPVWLGDDGSGNRCLLVEDPDPRKTCDRNTVALDFTADGTVADPSGSAGPALRLRLPETAAHPAVRVDFWAPSNGGQYLVITRDDALFPLDRSAAS